MAGDDRRAAKPLVVGGGGRAWLTVAGVGAVAGGLAYFLSFGMQYPFFAIGFAFEAEDLSEASSAVVWVNRFLEAGFAVSFPLSYGFVLGLLTWFLGSLRGERRRWWPLPLAGIAGGVVLSIVGLALDGVVDITIGYQWHTVPGQYDAGSYFPYAGALLGPFAGTAVLLALYGGRRRYYLVSISTLATAFSLAWMWREWGLSALGADLPVYPIALSVLGFAAYALIVALPDLAAEWPPRRHLASAYGVVVGSILVLAATASLDCWLDAREYYAVEVFSAAAGGDLPKLRELTRQDPDIVRMRRGGRTPLHAACGPWRDGDHCGVVELLLASGADVNERSRNGWTPLHFAANDCRYWYRQRIGIVKLLLSKGADVNALGEDGRTPLSLAVRDRNKELAELLLEHGADLNLARVGIRGAVGWDDREMVELLLRHGANVDARKAFGETPLFDAVRSARSGGVEMVELLLRHGADINARDAAGMTPLHEAISSSRRAGVEVIDLLLAKGADIEAKDERGWTPLMFAEVMLEEEAAECLRKHGAIERPPILPFADVTGE